MTIVEPVRSAAFSDDDVYVCSGTPSRLFHYHIGTQTEVSSVKSPPLNRLTVLGGKYLLAEVDQGPDEAQKFIRYELPNLGIVNFVSGRNTDLAGRMCGSDILWDGQLWDAYWRPKLLLHHPNSNASAENRPLVPYKENQVRLLGGGNRKDQASDLLREGWA